MINEKQLKRYCSEDISKIENYDLAINDDTQTWCCHHRLEIQGNVKRTPRELSRCGLYWNRPAAELILLLQSEHSKLHNLGERNPRFGKHMSVETKKKLSISRSGKSSWNKGKHMSEETKKKLSMSHSEKSGWVKGKHRSEETKKKCSAAVKGTHWWNNGIVSKQKRECPGEGWVRGRLKHNNHK